MIITFYILKFHSLVSVYTVNHYRIAMMITLYYQEVDCYYYVYCYDCYFDCCYDCCYDCYFGCYFDCCYCYYDCY